MLARFSRRLIALYVVLVMTFSFGLWDLSPLTALLLPLIWLPGVSVALAVQCVAAAHANWHDDVPRAQTRQLVRAWLRETYAASKAFLWWQPFRASQFPDVLRSDAAPDSSRGIVFVHGFICNRGVWNAWFPELARAQIPYLAINLEPLFASIDDYGVLLDDAVTRMHEQTGQPPLLVCHSMGGLVARAWIRSAQAQARVHRIVTIGSPHGGTRMGNWVPHLPSIANAHQMRFGGEWLTGLTQCETPEYRSRFVCFYSNCDNIVFPATSGALPGADNRHIPGLPHLAMAMDRNIMAQTLALL